jgi:hypothetical protein
MPAALRDVRAWIAVHDARTAFALILLAGIVNALTADTSVDGVGAVVTFNAPVPVPQFVALVAGIAIGAAATYRVDARFPLGQTAMRRLTIGRLIWGVFAAVVAVAAMAPDLAGDNDAQFSAVAANVVLFGGLSLFAVAAGHPDLAWLPPTSLLLVAILYGSGTGIDDFRWWAACLADTASGARWGAGVGIFTLAVGWYALAIPGRGRSPQDRKRWQWERSDTTT